MHKADYDNLYCTTCGEHFKSRARLARHLQKWNTKLRDKLLSR